MNHIRWTPSALEDLKTVSGYVERERNLSTANRVCRIIYDAIQTLGRFPETGKAGIEAGTRELVVPPLPFLHRGVPDITVQRRSNSSRLAWRTATAVVAFHLKFYPRRGNRVLRSIPLPCFHH